MGNVGAIEVLKQSEQVFRQFGEELWVPASKINKELPQKDANSLVNYGMGKVLLLCAMGESLEDHIETIKKYRDRVDIAVCDKGFGPLLEHGVKADFVMLCDASVPFKYIEPWIDQTDGVKLLSTPYGNTEWTKAWKGDRYFFVNRDSIYSENIFKNIFGNEIRTIPAGSNVSNAMLVFWTGCDNEHHINWGGYSKYLLVGFDYSWRPDGNYYAWLDPKPKRHYMHHRTILDPQGRVCFTSENLVFSARWLMTYCSAFNLPVANCSGRGILPIKSGNLEREMAAINTDKNLKNRIKSLLKTAKASSEAFDESMRALEREREAVTWQ